MVIKFFRSAKAETNSLSTNTVSKVTVPRLRTKRSRGMTNAAVYSSVFLLIIVIASIGYRPSEATTPPVSLGAAQAAADVTKPSVDQLAVAGLTAKTAEVANLSVASDASNAAITLNIKSELAQKDESVINKPQTFEPSSSSAILSYKTVAGDTAQSIASRYGISPQTLKWANNLTSDAVVPGADVVIPTVDGVVYTVKDGDTVTALATKYQSDQARIISKNDLELSTGLPVGQRIVLPGGALPENERPGYVAPRRYTANAATSTYSALNRANPMYTAQVGNRYGYGYCTWYAYNRRMQLGRPVGSFWGDASSWRYAATVAGFGVTRGDPEVGDVMQNGGGQGHVAVVEEKHANGAIRVSEMNYHANGGGWNIISYRTIDPGSVGSYYFIKNK